MEAEAIVAILGRMDRGEWTWIASEAVLSEIHRMMDPTRKMRVLKLVSSASRILSVNAGIVARSRALMAFGFTTMDAVHVACAEAGKVDVFLTTDDKLTNLATRHVEDLRVRVANPWQWLQEVIGI